MASGTQSLAEEATFNQQQDNLDNGGQALNTISMFKPPANQVADSNSIVLASIDSFLCYSSCGRRVTNPSDQGEGLPLAIQATDSSPSTPGSWTMMEFSSNLDQSSQLQVPLVFDQVDSASDERPAFQPCQLLLVPEPDVSLQLLQTLLDNSLLAAT